MRWGSSWECSGWNRFILPHGSCQAAGDARITLDFDLLTLRVEASFSGLLGNVTAAHIHCCTAPGSNVGVATMTPCVFQPIVDGISN
jgi:hypothetical protein